MILEARKRWGMQLEDCQEAVAEHLPYQDAFFDQIVCWGVFDACFQSQALSEMARVLKTDGQLLVTGKNDNYCDDDELAYTAEVNARAKGHPNFFTNFPKLLLSLVELGLKSEKNFYFERRGDLSDNRHMLIPPPHFYEYVLICKKEVHTGHQCSLALAHEFSVTFTRRNPIRL